MSDTRLSSDPTPPMDDSIVYVTEQGTQVGISDNRYVIRDVGNEESSDHLASFPVEKVETLCIFGTGVDVTTYTRATADEYGTIINYFTTNGRFRGRFIPAGTTIAPLVRQQYSLPDSDRVAISKRFVLGKLSNAIEYLRRKMGTETVGSDLLDAPERLHSCDTRNELRGIEGAAAREYFTHFERTLRDGWTMDGRTTQPPEDHVNSLLSLTYTFIQQEVESALRQVNLNPYVGIFHAERHGCPALALDLVEEFRRAFADRLVARLVNRGTIGHDQFTVENHLTDDAFDLYLSKYDSYMDESIQHPFVEKSLRRREVIRLQARLLRKRVVGDIDHYPPYRVDRR